MALNQLQLLLLQWHLKLCRHLYLKVNRLISAWCYLCWLAGRPKLGRFLRRALWSDGACLDVTFTRAIYTDKGLPMYPPGYFGH